MSMKSRCDNPDSASYEDYGGRGITYCDRWADFDLFFEDMGPRPPDTTLHRLDGDDGYHPGNCVWATLEVQNNTRRHCVFFEYEGETLTLTQIGRRTGVRGDLIRIRLNRGWDLQRAATTPPDRSANQPTPRLYDYRGQELSLTQLSNLAGINRPAMWNRLHRWNWTVVEAVEIPSTNAKTG